MARVQRPPAAVPPASRRSSGQRSGRRRSMAGGGFTGGFGFSTPPGTPAGSLRKGNCPAAALAWEARRPEVLALGYSEEFFRKYVFYFVYCAAGFQEKYIHDFVITWAKEKEVPRPEAPAALARGAPAVGAARASLERGTIEKLNIKKGDRKRS